MDSPLLTQGRRALKTLISNARRTFSLTRPGKKATAIEIQLWSQLVRDVEESNPGIDPLELLIILEDRAEAEGLPSIDLKEYFDGYK